MVQKGKDKFYFDSYGVQPPSELIAYLKSPIFYNSERVQQNGEVFCDHFCLFALKQLSMGNNLQAVINYLIVIIKMPVDKFGNGDRTTTVYTGINIANLTNSFLRRDGGNTAIGAIDMNSNIIKNVADLLSNHDVATKNYVDTNAFTTAGGFVSGDIKLNVGFDLVRNPGCNDISAGKKFTLLLGTDTNMLTYTVSNSGLPVPIKIKTDVGFAILIDELPICVFGRDEILCSRYGSAFNQECEESG